MQPQYARERRHSGLRRSIPASNVSGLERLLGVRVVGVRSVDEALEELLGSSVCGFAALCGKPPAFRCHLKAGEACLAA